MINTKQSFFHAQNDQEYLDFNRQNRKLETYEMKCISLYGAYHTEGVSWVSRVVIRCLSAFFPLAITTLLSVKSNIKNKTVSCSFFREVSH